MCDMNLHSIRRLLSFEFYWKGTTGTSLNNESHVLCVHVTRSIYTMTVRFCVCVLLGVYIHEVLVSFLTNWSMSA